jgi:hypothetical protein
MSSSGRLYLLSFTFTSSTGLAYLKSFGLVSTNLGCFSYKNLFISSRSTLSTYSSINYFNSGLEINSSS